jgi:hypothetical protein
MRSFSSTWLKLSRSDPLRAVERVAQHALAAGPALRAGRRVLHARAGQAAGRVLVYPSA